MFFKKKCSFFLNLLRLNLIHQILSSLIVSKESMLLCKLLTLESHNFVETEFCGKMRSVTITIIKLGMGVKIVKESKILTVQLHCICVRYVLLELNKPLSNARLLKSLYLIKRRWSIDI